MTIIEHTTSTNSARTENNKSAEENWKEPAKRILKRRAEREDRFAVLKAPRYGNWSPLPTSVERQSDSIDQSKPIDGTSAAEPEQHNSQGPTINHVGGRGRPTVHDSTWLANGSSDS